jgi:hypothetical protein
MYDKVIYPLVVNSVRGITGMLLTDEETTGKPHCLSHIRQDLDTIFVAPVMAGAGC